ncbi:hypothetical protein MCHI_000332 [Candidatus Magnetoovum chiemensis]|nr:hypothetical protein MCHI_000332 [Candidatus Magnetoovum chiemensis]
MLIEHVKGSELPDELAKRLHIEPDVTYTVNIEIEEDMPPEEMLKEEFVREIEKSDKEYEEGKGTLCKTKQESDAFFKEVWGD